MTTLVGNININNQATLIIGDTGDLNISSNGRTIFNNAPRCSVVPTTSNQLVNKDYLDNKITPAPTMQITDTGSNSIYYPTFVDGSGNRALYACISTNPISFNPGTSTLNLGGRVSITTGNTITINQELNQRLYSAPVYNEANTVPNGYLMLSKKTMPTLNPLSSSAQIASNWTQQSSNLRDYNYSRLVWAPSLKIFAAYSGSVPMISSDGINWQAGSSGIGFSDVCWSEELKMFAGVQYGVGGRILTSTDGLNWTIRVSQTSSYGPGGIIWSAEFGLFCAMGAGWHYTSSNGINWEIYSSSGSPEYRTGIWVPELKTLYGDNSNRVFITRNFINWEDPVGYANGGLTQICWSPELGLFCAVVNNTVRTSTDAINWSIRPALSANLNGICWAPELKIFCAVGNSGLIATSSNGFDWTEQPRPNTNNHRRVCWSPELGIFCIISNTGVGNRFCISSNIFRPPTSYNMFADPNSNRIDPSGNWTLKTKQIKTTDSDLLLESTSGDLELKCNSSGVGGNILLTGGTSLLSSTNNGSSGQYLRITVNGTPYKIALSNV